MPPIFESNSISIHDVIREEMYRILCDRDFRILVDHEKTDLTEKNAKKLFKENCYVFKAFKLAIEKLIQFGNTVYLLPWKSDKIVNTLFTLLLREKLLVDINAGIITIADTSIGQVKAVLQQLAQAQLGEAWILAEIVPERKLEKI